LCRCTLSCVALRCVISGMFPLRDAIIFYSFGTFNSMDSVPSVAYPDCLAIFGLVRWGHRPFFRKHRPFRHADSN
ncbi:hypothetical protein F4775DRAFT_537455, partial [Biscogniauxia sp. FL1348]